MQIALPKRICLPVFANHCADENLVNLSTLAGGLRLREFFHILMVWGIVQWMGANAQAASVVPTEQPAIIDMNFCRPAYPREAMRRGEQGNVKLRFTVGANGRLVGSSIVKSSGFRDLDTAALIALIHCSFKPAYLNDKPVQASFTMEYQWTLAQ